MAAILAVAQRHSSAASLQPAVGDRRVQTAANPSALALRRVVVELDAAVMTEKAYVDSVAVA